MKCNDIYELLSLYIDRMLDENQEKEVKKHLSACDSCTKEYNKLKEMTELLGQAEMMPVPDAFRFRLKNALNEEKQNMVDSGISRTSDRKNRWRIITSVAAVFAVGVITLSMYSDIPGILPDKLGGADQTEASDSEEIYEAAEDQGDDSGAAPGEANVSSDGSVMMKERESVLQPMAGISKEAVDNGARNFDYDAENDTVKKQEDSADDEIIIYGLTDSSAPDSAEENSFAADSGESEAGSASGEGYLFWNSKPVTSADDFSRSLTASGVERNAAAVQYYNKLIQDKLSGFDYQVLDSYYTQTGEWQFRIFIFRGKDGNTYNEEILIIGKEGNIKVICSNEFMGL